MIDLHSHILPGVDDGAKNMDESIEMINIALDEGVESIIATPHYIDGVENSNCIDNKKVLESLMEEVYKKNLNIDILLGNEVYSTINIDKLIEEKQATSLNKSRYVLIEFPMLDIPNYSENMIYNLMVKGYIPVIAHPERNARIIDDPNILYDFINKGALAQLNLGSITGSYGEGIRKTAEILVNHNMIHFLGTDAHSSRRRAPKARKALHILSQMIDEEYLNNICNENVKKVIDNNDTMIREPLRYEKATGIKGFFKRMMNIK